MTDFTYRELEDLDSAIEDSLTFLNGRRADESAHFVPRYIKRIKALQQKLRTLMHSEGSAA